VFRFSARLRSNWTYKRDIFRDDAEEKFLTRYTACIAVGKRQKRRKIVNQKERAEWDWRQKERKRKNLFLKLPSAWNFQSYWNLKLEITFLTHFSFPPPNMCKFVYCIGHKDPVVVSPIRLGEVFESTVLRTLPWMCLLWYIIHLPSLLVLKYRECAISTPLLFVCPHPCKSQKISVAFDQREFWLILLIAVYWPPIFGFDPCRLCDRQSASRLATLPVFRCHHINYYSITSSYSYPFSFQLRYVVLVIRVSLNKPQEK
jgi:hypothetical protein